MAATVNQTLAGATETGAPPPATRNNALRHIVIVPNARAGALLGRDDPGAELERLFRAAGAEVQSVPHDAGTLPERMEQARRTAAGCIVVAGGDGTIACAAQALAGTPDAADGPALGIIPSGTMNLLAKDLRIPVGDTERAISALMDGSVRAIDVGEVGGSGTAAHVFTCASMLGTPVALGRHREAGRHAGGGPLAWLSLVAAGVRALRRNRSIRLTLVCNGKRMKIRSPSVTITVNPLDDAAGRPFGRSCLDGGQLSIYIVRHNTPWRLLRVLVHAITSGSLHDRGIDVLRTGELVIESRKRALHVLVDGEDRLLEPPLHYRIRPRALRVVAPT
jgi:diacylglycerol kinase family enzyme